MNSQFKNSNLGFVIYASLIAIIVAATFFMLWYMLFGYKVGTYGPDTRLGSVYIGGLREDQVFSRVDDKVDYWYNDDTIVFEIKYQDYSYKIDRNVILFNTSIKAYNIEDGQTNEIYVSIQYTDQERIKSEILALPYMEEVGDNIDLQHMINDLLDDASLMKSYSCINVEDYLVDETIDQKVVSLTTFDLPQGITFEDLNLKVNDVYEDGKILVPGNSLFDVLDTFAASMTDVEMSVLAIAMLDVIHETNFIVNEVHYEPSIDFGRYTVENYPYYGKNTMINENILAEQSFSFYNPNEYDYYFVIEENSSGNGVLKLIGLPFEYDIDIVKTETKLGFITQETKDVSLLQEGHQGVIVEVVRTMTDV